MVWTLSARSSVNTTSKSLFKNAIVCKRSVTVRATNSTPSEAKMVGSGQNETVVPVVDLFGEAPIFDNFAFGFPPSINS